MTGLKLSKPIDIIIDLINTSKRHCEHLQSDHKIDFFFQTRGITSWYDYDNAFYENTMKSVMSCEQE